ncbi:response regulator transcription factor [Dactylosporangium sp. NPDC049742]|uniref:response regulator transcription factor n=1 Tax=unclassified Dactylosporangium TaxID=2621675 RepID=UPI0033B3FFA1
MTTVLIADDNSVVRAVVREMLTGDIAVVAEAANGAEALELARRHRPDVTLLDHRMPVRDGLSVVGAISTHSRVLMLTRSADDRTVLDAVRSGAIGFLVHGQFGPAELLHAVRAVAGGESHLSPSAARVLVAAVRQAPPRHGLSQREAEVMDLIARGLSNGDIAATLVLSSKTVENHVNRIFAKLGVTSRAGAIRRWDT